VDDGDAGNYVIVVKGHWSEERLEVKGRPEFKVCHAFRSAVLGTIFTKGDSEV